PATPGAAASLAGRHGYRLPRLPAGGLVDRAAHPGSCPGGARQRLPGHPPTEREGEGGLLVAVSQSGETADTLEAVRIAQERGIPVYGICNVAGSTLTRLAD